MKQENKLTVEDVALEVRGAEILVSNVPIRNLLKQLGGELESEVIMLNVSGDRFNVIHWEDIKQIFKDNYGVNLDEK